VSPGWSGLMVPAIAISRRRACRRRLSPRPWMPLLGAASIGILLPALSFAGSFTAFGPETYKRGTGREVPVVKRFTVLNPGVPYLLRVRNGVSGEFQAVSSGEIAINGTQVLGPHDFSSGGPVMEKPVTLAAS